MFPWWEQALDLAAVASSPVRTESQAGLGDLASLHVTVKVLRPHVSGRRRPNTNSAIYPFRGEVTQVAPRRVSLWAHEPGVNVVVSRHVTRYSERVILSFRHKGLEKLYREGTKKGVQADHVPKLLRILSALDVAQGPDDLAIPSFRTHRLKGDL